MRQVVSNRQCKIAIPERRETRQGEPHSQPALSLGTLSQPWHRLECEQSTAVLRVQKVGLRVRGSWSIWIVGQSLGEEDCADTGGPDVLVGDPTTLQPKATLCLCRMRLTRYSGNKAERGTEKPEVENSSAGRSLISLTSATPCYHPDIQVGWKAVP